MPSAGQAKSRIQRHDPKATKATRWLYTYDSLGQVTSGKRYWPDGKVVAGQQFEYAYDDIGNRKYAGSGGNEWGAGLRYENYSVNELNQYTQRTVPGSVDVIGAATNAATVTVNNTVTYRKGDYFRADLPLTNTASPVYASVTNLALLAQGTNAEIATNIVGNLFLPKSPEIFLHDPDGNLVQDGQWTNKWDAENRWIEAETISSVPVAAKKKLVFAYDHKWRRIRKTVYDWNTNTSDWVASKDLKFVYDSWNLLAELNATNNAVINSYMWGLDLSGTPEDAGGVGGLLAIKSAHAGVYFSGVDGNGNVEALLNTTNATLTAQYVYNPFGKLVRATGLLADTNPLRFSSKYDDADSAQTYYGYRYYNSHTGRWMIRDPIEELGSIALYAFNLNAPVHFVDYLGLEPYDLCVLLAAPDVLSKVPNITKLPGQTIKDYPVIQRNCEFRCYHKDIKTCYLPKCKSEACHSERDHGVTVRVTINSLGNVYAAKCSSIGDEVKTKTITGGSIRRNHGVPPN